MRDDDAGLRHDGELVVTADGDYTEVNADRDHATTGEPLSTPSGGQISLNGEAAEIDLKVWDKNATFSTADDMTGTGTLEARGEPSGRGVLVPRRTRTTWTRARTSWRCRPSTAPATGR